MCNSYRACGRLLPRAELKDESSVFLVSIDFGVICDTKLVRVQFCVCFDRFRSYEGFESTILLVNRCNLLVIVFGTVFELR